jgi:CBS domain containing-hemolysin-like protein
MIIHHLETIPEKDRVIELKGYSFIVEEVSERKIEKIRIKKSE